MIGPGSNPKQMLPEWGQDRVGLEVCSPIGQIAVTGSKSDTIRTSSLVVRLGLATPPCSMNELAGSFVCGEVDGIWTEIHWPVHTSLFENCGGDSNHGL